MNSAITSREKSLLVFVLIIAIVFCGISFAIDPLKQEIETNKSSSASASSEKVAMQEVVNSQISEQEMAQAVEEARGYYDELYNNEKMLRSDMHAIFTETAAKHSLTILRYSPEEGVTPVSQFQNTAQDNEKNPNVVQLQYYKISVEARGTYANILAYLDELKGMSSCLQVSSVSINIITQSENNKILFGGDGSIGYLAISKGIDCNAKFEIRLYEINKNIDAVLDSFSNPSDGQKTTETGDDQ